MNHNAASALTAVVSPPPPLIRSCIAFSFLLWFRTQEQKPASSERSVVTEIRDMEGTATALEAALLAFAKFLPRTVVRMLLRDRTMHTLGMHPAAVAIQFSDIVDFTGIAERLDPTQLIDLIGEYLQEMSAIIIASMWHGKD